MVEVASVAARRTNPMSPFLPPNPFWRSGGRAGGARNFAAPEGAPRPEQPPSPQRNGTTPNDRPSAKERPPHGARAPRPPGAEPFPKGGTSSFFQRRARALFCGGRPSQKKGKSLSPPHRDTLKETPVDRTRLRAQRTLKRRCWDYLPRPQSPRSATPQNLGRNATQPRLAHDDQAHVMGGGWPSGLFPFFFTRGPSSARLSS